MESGTRGDGWPGPEVQARHRLPRTEDLPPAEHGYDREKVNEAFDAFYRHIAQLDSTLRALEAVEVFRDQAGELRKELRALKAAGWSQQPWQSSYAPARVSPGLPESLPRFAIEAAFLVIVAVVVAVAGFDRLSIVLVMALAWAIVGVVEWAASRERFARRRVPVPAPARPQAEPAPAPLRIVTPQPPALPPAERWADPAVIEAPALEEEMTAVGSGSPAREADPEHVAAIEEASENEAVVSETPAEAVAVVPPAEEPEADAVSEVEAEQAASAEAEAEPDAEAEEQHGHWSWAADAAVERAREREQVEAAPAGRRRWWRRQREDDGYRVEPEQPRHVRVLPPGPSFDEQFPVDRPLQRIDPWEEDLDISIEEPERAVEDAPEREPAYAESKRDGEPDR